MINGRMYKEHRVIWFAYYGKWPINQIDHINGIKDDNRISNLREANSFQNQMNRAEQKNNTSGRKGVCFHIRLRKWQARIASNGKRVHIGYFQFKRDAIFAYDSACAEIHKEFARMS